MSWRDHLVPAAFRGVGFFVDGSSIGPGGRRVAEHEFPLRDQPATEDMGRAARHYTLRAYVIADPITGDYLSQAAALQSACDDASSVGLLDHPWLGAGIAVRCKGCVRNESAEAGGAAFFDLPFVEAGGTASPTATVDTASQVAAGAGSLLGALARGITLAAEIAAAPGILLAQAESLLGSAASAVLGAVGGIYGTVASVLLPGGAAALSVAQAVATAEAVANALTASLAAGTGFVTSPVTGATGDPVSIAITDMFATAATAVLAVQAALPDPLDSITGDLITAQRLAPDPSLGLAAIAANFGATLPPPVGLRADLQAALQADVIAVVTGAATLAVAQIYAATDFVSSQAAASARDQITARIGAQLLAAAAARNDLLYQAWLAFTGQVSQDLLQRVLQLPSLAAYRVSTSIPACVLAQSLYQDGSRGLELALLNDIPHPGFLPAQGVYLAA